MSKANLILLGGWVVAVGPRVALGVWIGRPTRVIDLPGRLVGARGALLRFRGADRGRNRSIDRDGQHTQRPSEDCPVGHLYGRLDAGWLTARRSLSMAHSRCRYQETGSVTSFTT